MTALVPLPASAFAAVYDTLPKTLTVFANGDIPNAVISAELVRDDWAGGLKFSLKGYWGGLNPPGNKAFKTQISEQIILPMSHFNNKTVLVETTYGTWSIDIYYTGITPPGKSNGAGNGAVLQSSAKEDLVSPDESISLPAQVNSVLPPQKVLLLGGKPGEHLVAVTASTPSEGFVISVEYNREYLRIWDTTVTKNIITWHLTWEKTPSGDVDPQDFTIYNKPVLPPGGTKFPGMIGTVQTYFVYLGLLKNSQ